VGWLGVVSANADAGGDGDGEAAEERLAVVLVEIHWAGASLPAVARTSS